MTCFDDLATKNFFYSLTGAVCTRTSIILKEFYIGYTAALFLIIGIVGQ